jgi:hypothetical protein
MLSIIILLGIVFSINELRVVFRPYIYDRQLKKIKSNLQQRYINPNDRSFILFNLLYLVWSVFGLFTTYWPIFLSLILIGVLSSITTKNIEIERTRAMYRVIDSLFSIVLISILIYLYISKNII